MPLDFNQLTTRLFARNNISRSFRPPHGNVNSRPYLQRSPDSTSLRAAGSSADATLGNTASAWVCTMQLTSDIHSNTCSLATLLLVAVYDAMQLSLNMSILHAEDCLGATLFTVAALL